MGNVFKKQRDIEIVNVISKKDLLKHPHLNLKGEIIIKKDIPFPGTSIRMLLFLK